MSSIRNAVARRNHRERAQPLERQRLGLLEKHKDYSLRAQDFDKKKKKLKALKAKIADKNPDEFYFGMMSRRGPVGALSKGKRWDGTVDGDRGSKVLDRDVARLLKNQDIGYLRTARNIATKEVKQLEERVRLAGGNLHAHPDAENSADDGGDGDVTMPPKQAKKIVFTDEWDPEQQIDHDIDSDMDVDVDDNIDVGSDSCSKEPSPDAQRAEERRQHALKLRRRLQASRKKLSVLSRAEHELEVQRAKMAKTATTGVITKLGKMIKVRERKR